MLTTWFISQTINYKALKSTVTGSGEAKLDLSF